MFQDNVEKLGNYIADANPNTIYAQLRPPQKESLRQVHYSLVNGNRLGIFKAPTGYGKSLIEGGLMEGMDTKTLVATSRIRLVDQLKGEYQKRAPHIPVTTYFSRNKDLSGKTNITAYPSLVTGLDSGTIAPDYGLVMYDEGHNLLSARRRQVVKAFPEAVQIAFTATPGYGENHHLDQILPTLMYSLSIRDAIQRDLGSSFSVFIVKTDVDLLDVRVKGKGLERDFNQAELEKAVNVGKRNKGAVDLWTQNFMGTGDAGISFCAGVDHAEAVAQEFRTQNVQAEAIHSYMKPRVQDEILDAYQLGDIDMLCNDKFLVEGVDFPRTSVIFNLRPTLSPVVAEQRAGRALRIDPNNPAKYTYIFDFIDKVSGKNTPISFAQVAEAAQVVNTWHQTQQSMDSPQSKRIYLSAEGFRVYTDSKEVMWAVNSGYEDDVKNDKKEWRTLRRMSAESGIPLEVMERLAWLRRVQISDYNHARKFRGPHGGAIDHYDAAGSLVMMMTAINSFGYESDFTSDIPEDPDFPFIKRESLEHTRYYRHYIAELTDLQKRMAGANEAAVAEYTKMLHIEVSKNPEKYGDF